MSAKSASVTANGLSPAVFAANGLADIPSNELNELLESFVVYSNKGEDFEAMRAEFIRLVKENYTRDINDRQSQEVVYTYYNWKFLNAGGKSVSRPKAPAARRPSRARARKQDSDTESDTSDSDHHMHKKQTSDDSSSYESVAANIAKDIAADKGIDLSVAPATPATAATTATAVAPAVTYIFQAREKPKSPAILAATLAATSITSVLSAGSKLSAVLSSSASTGGLSASSSSASSSASTVGLSASSSNSSSSASASPVVNSTNSSSSSSVGASIMNMDGSISASQLMAPMVVDINGVVYRPTSMYTAALIGRLAAYAHHPITPNQSVVVVGVELKYCRRTMMYPDALVLFSNPTVQAMLILTRKDPEYKIEMRTVPRELATTACGIITEAEKHESLRVFAMSDLLYIAGFVYVAPDAKPITLV